MKKDKAICIGGWMHGKEVKIIKGNYAPISPSDLRNYWSLSINEMMSIDEPFNQYYLLSINLNNLKTTEYFYLWNNDQKIFEDFLNNYERYTMAS
ncbi:MULTISPECIES: hypothetical protein [unclassified Acinetobacter]|uniref:hypothetical protein n=1 Tax=unclassified Acinetobacter TaxID=196816 RepID=UPI002934CFEF|nr:MULTISPECIES: hypothetical protein [unclassified Acinetobacter]WOE32281.1 hypothetical protein QSG84_03465 [Acinetobacter sp. SAAs470]WOE37752.1 hypothetical protein QSG86_12510 [Acinetobacter sp. SAAs474]